MSRTVRRADWGRCALAATLSLSLACSVMVVKKPRPSSAHPGEVECTETAAPPLIDTLLTGASLAYTVKVAQDSNTNYESSRAPTLFLSGIVASVAAISAIYGSKNVARCKALRKAALTMPVAPSPPTSPPATGP